MGGAHRRGRRRAVPERSTPPAATTVDTAAVDEAAPAGTQDGADGASQAPAGAGRAVRASLVSSLAVVVLNLATGVLTAQLLGPEGRAVVITATVWTSFSSWAFSIGGFRATQYSMARVGREEQRSIWPSMLAATTVLALFGALLPQLFVGLLIDDDRLLLPTREFLFATLLFAGYELVCAALSGSHQVERATRLRVLQPGSYVAFLLVVALLPGVDLTAGLALIGLGASFALAELIGIVQLVRHVGFRRPRVTGLPAHYRLGLRFYPGALASLVNARIDLLLLPAFVAVIDIGYYGVAANTSNILQIALGQVGYFLLPSLAVKSPAERAQALERAVRLIFGLAVLAATVGVLLARPAVDLLYGDQFEPSVPLLRILLFASVALSTAMVVNNGLGAAGMPGRASLAYLMGVPVTALGLYLTVPTYGVTGAAWTSLAAYASVLVVAIVIAPRDLLSLRRLLRPGAWIADARELRRRVRR